MSLSRREQRWKSVIWPINPWPIFNSFAQVASDRIHQDVTDFFCFLVMVAQTVIKKVALPVDFLTSGQKSFPVRNCFLHSGLARKSNNGVEMIRHQQHEPAMPDQFCVIVRNGDQDGLPCSFATQLVRSARLTVDGDEIK